MVVIVGVVIGPIAGLFLRGVVLDFYDLVAVLFGDFIVAVVHIVEFIVVGGVDAVVIFFVVSLVTGLFELRVLARLDPVAVVVLTRGVVIVFFLVG